MNTNLLTLLNEQVMPHTIKSLLVVHKNHPTTGHPPNAWQVIDLLLRFGMNDYHGAWCKLTVVMDV